MTDETRSDLDVRAIPLSKIEQGDNSRLSYNEEEMVSLMVSMKQTGLLQPIGLTEYEKGKFRVVFGNRRFLAAKKLGWKVIDATIFKTRDYVSEMIANLSENMVRGDVVLAETGRSFHQLTQEGLTLGEIAARVSIPKSKVKMALDAFNRVPVKFRNKIAHGGRKPGMIGGDAMQEILSMKLSPSEKEKVFEAATLKEMSKEQLANVAIYVKRGMSAEDAMDSASTLKNVFLKITLRKEVVEKLLKKYGETTIQNVMMILLKNIPELEL